MRTNVSLYDTTFLLFCQCLTILFSCICAFCMLSGGKDQIACTVATSVKVTGLKATALSKGRIQLKWTGYPTNYKNGYSRYVIEYKTSAKGAYKRLKLSGDSNGSYTLKSLKKGKTYYFRIRSYVKDTNSLIWSAGTTSPCFFLKPIPRPITITSAPDFSYAEIILLLITFSIMILSMSFLFQTICFLTAE